MHQPTSADEKALTDICAWVLERLNDRERTLPPLVRSAPLPTITDAGVGIETAWTMLRDEVLPTAIPSDHPRYLAFIPGSPTVASVLADMVVSASGVYAGGELDAGAMIAAERAALRWLSDLVGLPESAHGAFVSGGSIANLSALVAARHHRARRNDVHVSAATAPRIILTATGAHSSVQAAADIMGCELRTAGDAAGRLDRESLLQLLSDVEPSQVVAVVATAGHTNSGAIDDLSGIAELCHRLDIWLHVDAAYGGGGLLAPSLRPSFAGIEGCDSITIDPHKWLFTPYDCAAVIYRDPVAARRAHTQTAGYLDVYADDDNPADYAIHLSRRARGVPLWLSLVANGAARYREAVERCLELAGYAAEQVEVASYLELAAAPGLSVVMLRRIGWSAADYESWSERAIASGLGLITPTTLGSEPALRLCFVNPLTTERDVDRIVASLR